MLKNNQKGFSPLIIIVVLIVILAVGFAGYKVLNDNKNKDSETAKSSQSNTQNNQKTEEDLKIFNFGLASLDSVDITKNALRDFDRGLKGFYVFGEPLPGNRLNPNFEFSSLKEDTQVISAIDGVVVNIKEQSENGTQDTEVFIAPSENSKWIIGYDHLINVKAQKGDKVKVGDVLGTPNRQNNGTLRFEFQVNKKTDADDIHVCPATLLDSSVKEKALFDLKNMQTKWETDTGYELYDTDKQSPIGCIQTELTPAKAEGR